MVRTSISPIEERARWWSYRRQRLGRYRAPDAESALRDVVGVYSSHPTAPLSLHARSANFDADRFRALDALRLPAMRTSIFLLPRETAHLAFRAVPESPASAAGRLRYFGLSDRRYAGLREAVLAAAEEPRTARELREITGADGPLTPVIGTLTREGTLVRVGAEGLRSNALRYVAADVPDADPDGALAWLAGEYLHAFGPARAEDFRWWTGATKGRATAALSAVETVELDEGYLLPAGDREAFEAVEATPSDTLDLLPKWDCYTMGCAPDGRRRFVHPDAQDRVYTPAGDGLGVVLVNGAAAGAWEARFAGETMEVTLEMFETPGARLEEAIAGRFGAMSALLGARAVSLG